MRCLVLYKVRKHIWKICLLFLVTFISLQMAQFHLCNRGTCQVTSVNSQDHPSLGCIFCSGLDVVKHIFYAQVITCAAHCQDCMTVDFPNLITPENICSQIRILNTLIIIPTRIDEEDQRNALRQTWLRLAENRSTGHIFLIGSFDNVDAIIQKKIMSEALVYRDILQSDFLDTYRNLTIKTLTGLKWAMQNCPRIEFIIKADSDVFLNLDKWRSLMFGLEKPKLKKVLFGFCAVRGIVIRKPFNKWCVSVKSYPEAFYPPYCFGVSYGLSREVAQEVIKVSYEQTFNPMEDAYIGSCLQSLGRKVYNPPNLTIYDFSEVRANIYKDPCSVINELYMIHKLNTTEMLQLWRMTRHCKKRLHNSQQ